jgi:hypothetical protein
VTTGERVIGRFLAKAVDSQEPLDGRLICAKGGGSDYFNCCETLLNVVEALVPIVRIAPKQTTTIKANITAYSTAVGPSSLFKKLRILAAKFFMMFFSKSME